MKDQGEKAAPPRPDGRQPSPGDRSTPTEHYSLVCIIGTPDPTCYRYVLSSVCASDEVYPLQTCIPAFRALVLSREDSGVPC